MHQNWSYQIKDLRHAHLHNCIRQKTAVKYSKKFFFLSYHTNHLAVHYIEHEKIVMEVDDKNDHTPCTFNFIVWVSI